MIDKESAVVLIILSVSIGIIISLIVIQCIETYKDRKQKKLEVRKCESQIYTSQAKNEKIIWKDTMSNQKQFMSTKEAANKWNISQRRVSILCIEGRIENTQKVGNMWIIPIDAKKPQDNRRKN